MGNPLQPNDMRWLYFLERYRYHHGDSVDFPFLVRRVSSPMTTACGLNTTGVVPGSVCGRAECDLRRMTRTPALTSISASSPCDLHHATIVNVRPIKTIVRGPFADTVGFSATREKRGGLCRLLTQRARQCAVSLPYNDSLPLPFRIPYGDEHCLCQPPERRRCRTKSSTRTPVDG